MRRGNSQRGFTIVELMIIVTIVGVLAALVLPNVRSNAVRARMSEAILSLSTCKNQVVEMYASGDPLPNAGEWGCEGTNNSIYVMSVTTTGEGVIIASLKGFNDLRIDFHEVTLAPLDNSGAVMPDGPGSVVRSWRCGSPLDTTQPVPPQYLPASCRG
jgi:type IV pilus assembly protein PilA